MRRLGFAALVVALATTPVAGATPLDDVDPMAPPIVSTWGVEQIASIPEAADATAVNFLTYGDREVLFVSGRFGLLAYDVTDPADPARLDGVDNDTLRLDSDDDGTFWQNEGMPVDAERGLVFLSRDPRAYDGDQATGTAGVYIIDAADPADLELLTFHELPAGHTATCINDCQYLWSGGPTPAEDQPDDWEGRPIFVTDITDPANPETFDDPVDIERNDGVTDYAHDVQVDADGIAWVSGRGGVRGYHTTGEHHDPIRGETREATAWDPVPFAGGGIDGAEGDEPGRLVGLSHNSHRPVGATAGDGHDTDLYDEGSLIYVTEEAIGATCASDGKFFIASLDGSYDGEAWRSTPNDPFRLDVVGEWDPVAREGMGAAIPCSAHYFELQDGIAAYSWYGQGTRFLDVTDPSQPIQIAYYRPLDANSWAAYWRDEYAYIADGNRGVDIIRLTDDAFGAQDERTEVLAPPLPPEAVALRAETLARYAPDPVFGWACRLPTD